MTNNESDYPDDLIGHTQEEIVRLVSVVDDLVPFADNDSHAAMTLVLVRARSTVRALDLLRRARSNDSTV